MTTMLARVLEQGESGLWVVDLTTSQEILVLGENLAQCSPNDVIEVTLSGQSTKGIPPQMHASAIRLVSSCGCGHVHAD